jgi:DNA-damage-inducible protein D
MTGMSDLTPWPRQFEGIGKPNGSKYWLEADLMAALDYHSEVSWQGVINKAVQACVSLKIPVIDNFISLPGGSQKLTRFACYLVAMNGDPNKPPVAAAQAYFARLAESVQDLCDHAGGVERVLIRDELTGGQRALASTAKSHGVANYAFFQNAGYRGMYNMDLARLNAVKGVPRGLKLIDLMGKEELAANLFRITQTDAKIKNEEVSGQQQLERVAHEVGRKVRRTMIELSGTEPERLPVSEPIQQIKKSLKGTNRRFRKIDTPGPPRE